MKEEFIINKAKKNPIILRLLLLERDKNSNMTIDKIKKIDQ